MFWVNRHSETADKTSCWLLLQGLKWDKLRCFSSTGEASSPEGYHWLSAMAGYKPVIEYCGGTEIGGGFLSGTMVQPQAPSHFSTPSIGSRLALIDDQKVLFDSLAGEADLYSEYGSGCIASYDERSNEPYMCSNNKLHDYRLCHQDAI